MTESLLRVEDLAVSFDTDAGRLRAVDGISFDVPAKSTVALVGESGCGKTVTALAIMRLLPSPPGSIDRGSVRLGTDDLMTLSERQMREVRGARIGFVFQDPLAALDPVYSVGSQVVEALRLHVRLSRREAKKQAIALLAKVGFPEPETRFDAYPHELSGGMRQRVLIAIAIACEPELVIADEPTTALDMLAASEVATLLSELKRERDASLLLISHDIGMIAGHADRIVVLYAGQVVEQGPAAEILAEPKHPYTKGLLQSIPPLRKRRRRRRKTPTRLPAMAGGVPDMVAPPTHCRFAPRCPAAFGRCREEEPVLYGIGDVAARCFLYDPAGAHDEAPIELVAKEEG